MLNFILKYRDEGNHQGAGIALTIYRMLEIASYKQNLKPLPKLTEDISVSVEEEIAKMGEDYFVDDVVERLREDNTLLAEVVAREINSAGNRKSVKPTVEMYRMLEIAEEEDMSAKLANGNFEKN